MHDAEYDAQLAAKVALRGGILFDTIALLPCRIPTTMTRIIPRIFPTVFAPRASMSFRVAQTDGSLALSA
jgi:hypothetical protein